MTRPLYVPVVLGTPRQGRMSEHVARAVYAELGARSGVETELVDIAELPSRGRRGGGREATRSSPSR